MMSDPVRYNYDMSDGDIEAVLTFLERSGDLKDTLRSGFTNDGRCEDTASHSWRLALWIIALEPWLEGYDTAKLFRLAILHDLGEAVVGDVPATEQTGASQAARQAAERNAVVSLTAPLGPSEEQRLTCLFDDYSAGESREAALIKGLDKLETLWQHATGRNPDDFDYAFNLSYGETWTKNDPLLTRIRAQIDKVTAQRMRTR